MRTQLCQLPYKRPRKFSIISMNGELLIMDSGQYTQFLLLFVSRVTRILSPIRLNKNTSTQSWILCLLELQISFEAV